MEGKRKGFIFRGRRFSGSRRLLLTIMTAAALIWPYPIPAEAAAEPAGGLPNQVVPDDGRTEAGQAPVIIEEKVPVNNVVVPDTGEENEIDAVIPVGNILTKDEEGAQEEGVVEERVPLSDMIVPIGEEEPTEDENNPFVDILVPGDISFVADPYEILGKGTILSDEYAFENNSSIAVIINLLRFEYIPPDMEGNKGEPTLPPEGLLLKFVSDSLNLCDYESWENEKKEETADKPKPTAGKPEPTADTPEPATDEPKPDTGESLEPNHTDEPATPQPEAENRLMDSNSVANTDDSNLNDYTVPEEAPSPEASPEGHEGATPSEAPNQAPDKTTELQKQTPEAAPSGSALELSRESSGWDEGETGDEGILIYRHSEENKIVLASGEKKISRINKDEAPILSFVLMGDQGLEDKKAVFRMEGEIDPEHAEEILNGGRIRLVFSCVPYEGIVTDEEEIPSDPETGTKQEEPEPGITPEPQGTATPEPNGETGEMEQETGTPTPGPTQTAEPEEQKQEVTPEPTAGILTPPPEEPSQGPETIPPATGGVEGGEDVTPETPGPGGET